MRAGFLLLVCVLTRPLALPAQSTASSSTATPFGLRMGMTRAELSRISELRPLEGTALGYMMPKVPKPHTSFESYLALVSPSVGLCKVVGVGNTIESSSFGTELVSEFKKLEGALEARYGAHKTFDHLRSGSIWDESNDWMMALHQKERVLSAYWDDEEGSSLPGDLQGVNLEAKALNSSKGYVSLTYEFSNMATCSSESEKVRDDPL